MWKGEVKEDDEFETAKGWCFLVIGYSKSIFKGSFRMRIWIESSDGFLTDPTKEAKLNAYAVAKEMRNNATNLIPN